MTLTTPLLSLKGISKVFPGVTRPENVHLDLWPGKVTALIGENGAGKSTLVKVMTGIYQPEEGELLYKAIPINAAEPGIGAQSRYHRDSSGNGAVRRTYRHRKYFCRPLYLPRAFQKLDWPAMHQQAQEILTRLEVQIDPHATLKTSALPNAIWWRLPARCRLKRKW